MNQCGAIIGKGETVSFVAMNALTSLGTIAPLPGWDQAQEELHLWLGRCIESFTAAESKVCEALLVLAQSFPDAVAIGKAHLFGHKLQLLRDTLNNLVESDVKRARSTIQALDRFQPFADLRNSVCHGASTLFLSRDGNWLVELKLVQLTGSEIVTSQLFIDREAAAEKLKFLRSAVQSLDSRLANLCASLASSSQTNPSAPKGQGSR
ncbi:hypothetical protein [Blastomonas natatoria]|uniref:hypothetical protein n=1 Tax=Blastomonas natatoria TaxID=34015 RepID=UPI0011B4E737|nr:hypothetical protein [Blastomonas natatoria]